ncbi:MAG: DUF6804 family protein [Thermodesulfobacteriota bacterium]
MITHKQVFRFPALTSSIMLILAVFEGWPYGYYTLLRLVVCGSASYVAFISYSIDKKNWMWVMVFIALLFNPLIPIHLDKTTWLLIDIIVALLFIVVLFKLK